MSPQRVRFTLFLLAVCLPATAGAQQAPPPAYIVVVEGPATIERDAETINAVVNMPLVPGDRLRTGSGRVEIMFPDGSGIEVGSNSEIEMLSPTRVRLIFGTMDHLQRPAAAPVSTGYLPQDLQMYGGTMQRYGSWGYDAPYGYVWYPTVAADWRPYYYGSWSAVPTYGWTWVGLDAWSWPTHHYGRWGYSRARWFWIPGSTWGPAWVSWAAAPDYVSWCPLGYDSRPVFALSLGYSGWWNGWTVLPRGNFGALGYYAHRNAVDPRRFTRDTPFIVQNTPPIPATRAGRATVTGPPAPSGFAVPRGADSRDSVGRRAPVTGNPEPAGDPREPNVERRAPATSRDVRPMPNDARPTVDDRRVTTSEPRSVAVPRNPTPDYRPPTPDYRVPRAEPRAPAYEPRPVAVPRNPTPDYRLPTPDSRPPTPDYRVPRAVPRTEGPPERIAPPPPARSAPERSAPPARSAPERSAPPPRSAPAASGARERSGGSQPAGQAQPRGEGRPAESGRRPR